MVGIKTLLSDVIIGELCVEVLNIIARLRVRKGCRVTLQSPSKKLAGSGFSLPANFGDMDPSLTVLDLSKCCLIGWLRTVHI